MQTKEQKEIRHYRNMIIASSGDISFFNEQIKNIEDTMKE
jgi:hypothetical protein